MGDLDSETEMWWSSSVFTQILNFIKGIQYLEREIQVIVLLEFDKFDKCSQKDNIGRDVSTQRPQAVFWKLSTATLFI